MTDRAETGRRGEQAAAEYLRLEGYEICAVNWRTGRYEVDIIARKYDVIHFVEVKTRRAAGLTSPEDAITPAKFRALQHAATRYLALMGDNHEVQFDLAAVDTMADGGLQVRFTEHAMEYHW